jgi:phosphate:Na+ symporter
MGLGLVFFGMSVMSAAMKPLRSYQPFLTLMRDMGGNPILGILVSASFTALVQSSSATTGIVIVMASEELITLNAGIALIFGSNIGTCVTALLASLGKPIEAVRAGLAHILFNVIGVLIIVGRVSMRKYDSDSDGYHPSAIRFQTMYGYQYVSKETKARPHVTFRVIHASLIE